MHKEQQTSLSPGLRRISGISSSPRSEAQRKMADSDTCWERCTSLRSGRAGCTRLQPRPKEPKQKELELPHVNTELKVQRVPHRCGTRPPASPPDSCKPLEPRRPPRSCSPEDKSLLEGQTRETFQLLHAGHV